MIQEIIFVAEIRSVLRGGCRQHGKSPHHEATRDHAGYSNIRQEWRRSVHHEVAGGRRQGYLRVHPHENSNGCARNVHDPSYHATNAIVLFLSTSSMDQCSRRNRLMHTLVIQ